MLNVNWEQIHSIILSVTCHGFTTEPLAISLLLETDNLGIIH